MYKNIINESLNKVVSEPGYQGVVRQRFLHELSLTHRLAVHLENSGYFNGYIIDCDYNKHGDGNKVDSASNKEFRPDILIHIRGNDEDNLIIIEAKKSDDPQHEIVSAQENLRNRRIQYRYKYAYLVIFPENEITNNSIIEIIN